MNDTVPDSRQKRLDVSIRQSGNDIILDDGKNQIQVRSSHPGKMVCPDRADFAVWFFLPIVMRTNQALHIRGIGTPATVKNAEAMSRVWQAWVPGSFCATRITFDHLVTRHEGPEPGRSLCFYSGGIDSTYTLLKRLRSEMSQDLLTVHGMDYKVRDKEKFESFLKHTSAFANCASDTRILVETDASQLYKKFKINETYHHISHIFALAGVGFLHAKEYTDIIIAADRRLDQQFVRGYYGSNSATNFLFDDGTSRLVTDSDDVTRSEKMPLLLESEIALRSLTFCVDKSSRPLNCGVCSKCMRTKLMFLASTGVIPPIFKSDTVPEQWFRCFEYRYPKELSDLLDVIISAKRHGHTDAFPRFAENEGYVFAHCGSRRARFLMAMRQAVDALLPWRT